MEASSLKVKMKTREAVRSVKKVGCTFLTETETWSTRKSDAVIVACGSPASSIEGASDTACAIAESFGHTVIPFRPALVPLREPTVFQMGGVRISASATLILAGADARTERGEIQLTDYGISGIPVFQLSRFAVRAG
ncbi:MAG: NAD(P)/FAD-dependent oxidoreductase [Lachnospiraceae bacterium]